MYPFPRLPLDRWSTRPPGQCGLGSMAVPGQSRRLGDGRVTSAFPLIADVRQRGRQVRKVPKAEALDWTILLPFSQLGGLHGAQWSRSSDLKRIMEGSGYHGRIR